MADNYAYLNQMNLLGKTNYFTEYHFVNNVYFINSILYLHGLSNVFHYCSFNNSEIYVTGGNNNVNKFLGIVWLRGHKSYINIEGCKSVHFTKSKFIDIESFRDVHIFLMGNANLYVAKCFFEVTHKTIMLIEFSDVIYFSNVTVKNVKTKNQNGLQHRSLFIVQKSKLFISTNSNYKDINFSLMMLSGIVKVILLNSTFVNCICPLRIIAFQNKFHNRLLFSRTNFISCYCKFSGSSLTIILAKKSSQILSKKAKLNATLSNITNIFIEIKEASFYNSHSELNGGALAIGFSHLTRFRRVYSFLSVSNTTFYNNTSDRQAGAIFVTDTNLVSILYCTFISNKAKHGAALVFIQTEKLLCARKHFSKIKYFPCQKKESGNFMKEPLTNNLENKRNSEDWPKTTTLKSHTSINYKLQIIMTYGSIFRNNAALLSGGAVYIINATHIFIEKTQIINNSVNCNGAGLYIKQCTFSYIKHSIFINNIVYSAYCKQMYGGAICITNSILLKVLSNIFLFNKAFCGSAIFVENLIKFELLSTYIGHHTSVIAGDNTRGYAIENKYCRFSFYTKCLFFNNKGKNIVSHQCALHVNSCTFQNNSESKGPAVHGMICKFIIIVNSHFAFNRGSSCSGFDVIKMLIINSSFTYNLNPTSNYTTGEGAGINTYRVRYILISKSNFLQNFVTMKGGGIFVQRCLKCFIIKSNFIENKVVYTKRFRQSGAALYVFNIGNILIQTSHFVLNSAPFSGGAVLLFRPNTALFENCLLRSNTARKGGAISVEKSFTITILNSYFYMNRVLAGGGGLYTEHVQKHILFQSYFFGNEAFSGGSVYILQSDLTIIALSSFERNMAHDKGGCLFLMIDEVNLESSVKLNTVYFLNNRAQTKASVMYTDVLYSVNIYLVKISSTSNTFARTSFIKIDCMSLVCNEILFENLMKHVLVLDIHIYSTVNLQNVTFLCPGKTYLNEFSFLHESSGDVLQLSYTCATCVTNTYILHHGLWSVSKNIKVMSVNVDESDIKCRPCPANAVCLDGIISAKPNYWGYVVGKNVFVIACPAGYCCQNTPCPSYDSCKHGRQGILCSKCQKKFSLALKSRECLLDMKCEPVLFWLFFILSTFVYCSFLLLRDEIFKVFNFLKRLYRIIKYFICSFVQKINKTCTCLNRKPWRDNASIDIKLENWMANIPFLEIWQIFVYHIQDMSLLQVEQEFKPIKELLMINKFQKQIKDILHMSSLIPENICLAKMTIFRKLSVLILMPLTIFMCLLIGLGAVHCLKNTKIMRSWSSSIFLAIIASVMYSNQKITSILFSLIQCVLIDDEKHLFIYAETKCWHIFQILIFVYISVATIPQCLVFLLAPRLLHTGTIGKWQFLFALFCPLPCVLYWIYLICNKTENATQVSLKCSTTLKIIDEIQGPFSKNKLSVWLCFSGLIEIRRLSLVLCDIFLLDKFHSHFAKTGICFLALISITSLKPYKGKYLNALSTISLFSQIIVGMCSSSFALMISLTPNRIPIILPVLYIEQLFSLVMPLVLSLCCALIFAFKFKFESRS